jgi:hypothetical protein
MPDRKPATPAETAFLSKMYFNFFQNCTLMIVIDVKINKIFLTMLIIAIIMCKPDLGQTRRETGTESYGSPQG